MLNGGLTQQTMTILAGSPGTGKTLLSLQFLAAGLARGEAGLYLGFHESRAQLLAKAAQFGVPLADAVATNRVRLMVRPPVALDADILAHELADALAAGGYGRLVVDSIVDLEALVPPGRAREFLAALVTLLRGHQVTTIMNKEISRPFAADVDFTDLPISVLAENVLLLRQVPDDGRLRRVVSVLKMRFSEHDRRIREFTVDARGLVVLELSPGAAAADPDTVAHGESTPGERPITVEDGGA
jgi:circadian clock protein KaiC